MYRELHNRLHTIKNNIVNNKPLTKQELADTIVIALTFDSMISALKKESDTNE